jgi:tellurite resistance protein TehA-like permease
MDSTYSDLVNATIGTATVNGNQVTTITYSLTDGGPIDTDKATNGSITDPVGPGILASTGSNIGDGITNLVNTGVGVYVIIVTVLTLLTSSSILIYRNKRRGVR